MVDKLWIDTETRSSIPLKHGVYKYASGPDAAIMTVQWAVDDGPVHVEDLTIALGMPASAALVWAAKDAREVWAHVSEFDRTMLSRASWWPRIALERWRCTAALARMHGLPGGLDKLCSILKVPMEEAKDAAGKPLIMLFCVPKDDGTYNDRKSHPLEWLEFLKYGGSDITSMRAVYYKLPKWNGTPRMWSLWALDQKMNDRGVAVDIGLAEGAVKITGRAKLKMAARTAELTGDKVEATTHRDRLLAYMADEGVTLPDLTADTVARRLEDENLPEVIKELLRIRQRASKSSTAKYKRVVDLQIEGRIHGLLLFCGASRTGRWAGRYFQPQNLYRGTIKGIELETAITAIKLDCLELLYAD
jgi:DNA polymerase